MKKNNTMTLSKRRVGGIILTLTVLGVGLCLSSLFSCDWYSARYVTGIVVTRVAMGMLVDSVCVGHDPCTHRWILDAGYDRHIDSEMPLYYLVMGFMVAALTLGLGACGAICTHLASPKSRHSQIYWSYFFHYTPLIVSGILAMVAPILLFVYGNIGHLRWAPLLPLIGGAVMIVTGFASMAALNPYKNTPYRRFENELTQTKIVNL